MLSGGSPESIPVNRGVVFVRWVERDVLLMHHCPSQFPSTTASTPPMTLMTMYSIAEIHRSTVKNNTSPSSKLLNVVYAPKNPTVRNKRRVGPMRSVASANGVTKARRKAPVRLMNRISYGQPFPISD